MSMNKYAFGEFATIELLKNHFSQCKFVYVKDKKYVSKLKDFKINIKVDPNLINKLIKKEDIYIISEFTPYKMELDRKSTHILIHNLNDEGEIGTIIRTAVCFNFKNIALINCDVDIFSSKIIRSSTGAIFMSNIVKYKNINEYKREYKNEYIEFINKDNLLSLEVANKLYKVYAASI